MSRSTIGKYFCVTMLMILMIFDSRQVVSAAGEGVQLCIRSAIPSLFPFFVLSGILVPGISALRIPALRKILNVPAGWESVFLLSAVGGYPMGAQCIAQGYRSKQISNAQAQRMLGFCNNCGPSFLFGVVAPLFPNPGYAAGLMGTGLLSAVIVASFWPGEPLTRGCMHQLKPVPLPKSIKQALSSMASVCAWIILGKIAVEMTDQYLLCFLPETVGCIITGMLEITNGCFALGSIQDLNRRLLAAAFIIPFGGISVAMQIHSICADAGLSTGSYLPQKLIQAVISLLIVWLYTSKSLISAGLIVIWLCFWILFKTAVAFPKKLMYNETRKGGFRYAVPKEN